MNRAFVREPDDSIDPRCPKCGVLGWPVARHTVTSLAKADVVAGVSDAALFCHNASCKVVYYDANGQTIEVTSMKNAVWPKDSTAPVCGCYGVTQDLIEDDARAGRRDALKLLATKSEESPTRCEFKSPSGRGCLAEVQRIFLKTLPESPAASPEKKPATVKSRSRAPKKSD